MNSKKLTKMTNCYCGRTNTYTNCCAPIHTDIHKVITAEDLMRSRYSAFVKANGNYLMISHHSSTRPTHEKKEIVRWAKAVQWVKLEVLHTTKGQVDDTEGTVEFKAFFFEKGQLQIIHENSKFIKENNHWVYLGEA